MNDKYQGLFEGSDSLCVFANACRIFTEGNCRISFCNNEPSDVCYSRSTWGDRARDIEAACAPNDGGYQYPPAPELWTEVAIRLNTDWGRLSTESGYKEISIEEEKAELRTFYEATSEANEIESLVCVLALSYFSVQKLTRYIAASGQILRCNHTD